MGISSTTVMHHYHYQEPNTMTVLYHSNYITPPVLYWGSVRKGKRHLSMPSQRAKINGSHCEFLRRIVSSETWSLETDLAGCPRLPEDKSRHAEMQACCCVIQTPTNIFKHFCFLTSQKAQIAASITTSSRAARWIKSNAFIADKYAVYKHEAIRQNRTDIYNRHHVPFVWNKPPLIVRHSKGNYELFRCSLMVAHLQLVHCIWLHVFFCRVPCWSACLEWRWTTYDLSVGLCLHLFITLHLYWECYAKPVLISSAEYHNECETCGKECRGLLHLCINKVNYMAAASSKSCHVKQDGARGKQREAVTDDNAIFFRHPMKDISLQRAKHHFSLLLFIHTDVRFAIMAARKKGRWLNDPSVNIFGSARLCSVGFSSYGHCKMEFI